LVIPNFSIAEEFGIFCLQEWGIDCSASPNGGILDFADYADFLDFLWPAGHSE